MMKQLIFSVSALLFLCFAFQSCDRRNCDEVVCPGVYTYCDKGNCFCLPGYEGTNCDEVTSEKYIGQYRVTESCTTSTGGGLQNNNFTAFITQTNRIDIINIDNFTIYGGSLLANVIDATTIYIQEQNSGAISISGGQGIYQPFNRTLRLEYNFTVSGNFHSCTGFYTRF